MNKSQLESFILDKMSLTGLPGLSIAIVEGDKVVYARGFGQRNIDSGLPATPGTVYSCGSVTKSFTALAILQLAEQNKLSLDDDISKYLDFHVKPKGKDILIKHLLSHSSGIPSLAYAEALIGYANGMGGKTLPISGPKDILAFAADTADWVEASPGERWFYFNEGYAMLGQIIEDVSGQSYNDYIAKNILKPLGMQRSVFEKKDVEAMDDVAVPYNVRPGLLPVEGRYLYRSIRSEGGLITSVLDLAKYISMFLSGGKGIVSKPSLNEMFLARVNMPWINNRQLFAIDTEPKPAAQYAYGLIRENFFGETLISHGGSVGVATAQIAFLPKAKLGVAILTNGSGYATSQFAKVALASYLKKDISKLSFLRLEDSLMPLTGRYESYKGTMQASVVREADFLKLVFHYGEQKEKYILVPESLEKDEKMFFTLQYGQKMPVSFKGRDGKIELIFERYKLKRIGPN